MDKFGKNIGFIVAGYPNLEHSKEVINRLDESVLDALEVGIPYSDPIADGKSIFKASFEALNSGVNVNSVFEILQNRKSTKPIILLVYYNIIFAYGELNFIKKCKELDIKGLIVPDLPFEENLKLFEICQSEGICLIPLVSLTSKDRLDEILTRASGFVYVVGVIGITGSKQASDERIKELVELVRKRTNLPVAVGFGIRENGDVIRVLKYADAAIIGTKIVELCKDLSPSKLMVELENLYKI